MINENGVIKHIDLSSLPKLKNGKINWVKSIGYSIPFTYGDINGNIILIKYIKEKRTFEVFIDGYTKYQYDTASIDTIKQCQFGRLLHKKIIDTNPELIKYFVNKNDALKYSVQSNVRVETECPFCGYIKNQTIVNLYKFGFSCPQCSDGISYPNKLMFNILTQLGIDFKNEITKQTKGFEWVENYRYDFYFENKLEKYFIEMDGHFHKNNTLYNYEKTINADQAKDKLAKEHNVHIIRINCCYDKTYDRFDFIRNEIFNSKLYELLDLYNVNWDIANQAALTSNIYLASQYWNNGDTIKQITEKLRVSRYTVRSYLKIAADINMCDYNEITSKQRKIKSHILSKNNIYTRQQLTIQN